MTRYFPLPTRWKAAMGFTLIELMIVLAIIAVIAAVALPSYQGQIRKSRRAEAVTFMSQVQQAQERYRANISKYGDRFVLTGGGLSRVISNVDPDTATYASAATSFTTSGGYYTLGLSGATGTGYTVFANAQGSQVNDGSCKYMQMALAGGNITYDSGVSSGTLNGPTSTANIRCWNR
jgi:type IV pilus assembly protein PilE